jgi:hypothetical protein
MEPVVELWSCLHRVRSLRFVAQSALATGWNGVGTGSVIVGAPADSVLIFTESGSWQPTGGRPLRFSNVFRWSRINADLIRLEHLRFGADQPVYLFDLSSEMGGEWISVSPHLCEQDCYAAKLWLQERGLWLRWTITGPKKQECIEYFYEW